jgi:radical SAM superfamily enzyme YgiQ (UPF0313 family)
MSYNYKEYHVYEKESLLQALNSIIDISDDIKTFYETFNIENVLRENEARTTSNFVFKNRMKEDTTKSKITQALNKLHQQNIGKVVSMIREIEFKSFDDLNELVSQCIQKIKRENEQMRPIISALCYELLSTYFISSTGEKIYLRKLLLSLVKNEYIESLNFNGENWSKDKSEKSIILIATFFNSKIIDEKIMKSIFDDLKQKIKYKENETQEYYENVEKSIQYLSLFVSIINDNTIYDSLDKFLEDEMVIYEEKKCITKKIRIVCKNIITELRTNKM